MIRSGSCQLAANADACRYRIAVEPRNLGEGAWWRWAQSHQSSATQWTSFMERAELVRLRREHRQLRQEREILAKAAAWFARETDSIPSGSSNS